MAIGLLLLVFKPYRTWMVTQLYLAAGALRNLWNKEIAWEKQDKKSTIKIKGVLVNNRLSKSPFKA